MTSGNPQDNITGRLEKWYVDGPIIRGYLHGDIRQRWLEGTWIRTSRVTSSLEHLKEGDIVTTMNSKYLLGEPMHAE